METDEIKDKKRKRVVATIPKMFYDPSAIVQFITREAFEAALCKPPNIVKSSIGSPKVIIPPSINGSIIQIITREDFEDAVDKLPNSRTGCGLPCSRSIFLDEGSYGMVYRATNNGNVEGDHLPSEMAIKCASIASASSLINEEEILINLTSPYVIFCYGSKITTAKTRFGNNYHNLILEYCAGGSIANFLKYQREGMAEAEVQLFAKDILKGINYIHSKKIIHCDIKPDNILLKPMGHNRFELKLADFGLAIEKKPDGYEEGKRFKRGTLLYISLELLRDGILDYGADIWAYGCTVLEMFTGKSPWSELRLNDKHKLKEVISNSEINQEIMIHG